MYAAVRSAHKGWRHRSCVPRCACVLVNMDARTATLTKQKYPTLEGPESCAPSRSSARRHVPSALSAPSLEVFRLETSGVKLVSTPLTSWPLPSC